MAKRSSSPSLPSAKKRRTSPSSRSPSPPPPSQPDIERFVLAQAGVGVWGNTYDEALDELKNGRKRGHWIWYVFPQVDGLSMSKMGKRFSIHSLDEARAYLAHPTLGARLKEATEAALEGPTKDVEELFGNSLDAEKFRSSMTLFAIAAQGTEMELFERALDTYWDGEIDEKTLEIMNAESSENDSDGLQADEEDPSDAGESSKHTSDQQKADEEDPSGAGESSQHMPDQQKPGTKEDVSQTDVKTTSPGTSRATNPNDGGIQSSTQKRRLCVKAMACSIPAKAPAAIFTTDQHSQHEDNLKQKFFLQEIAQVEAEIQQHNGATDTASTEIMLQYAQITHDALVDLANQTERLYSILGPKRP